MKFVLFNRRMTKVFPSGNAPIGCMTKRVIWVEIIIRITTITNGIIIFFFIGEPYRKRTFALSSHWDIL